MKKILVPVDFSGHTQITCSYAMEMAAASETEILLFHTYFDQIIITDTSFPDTLNMSSVYNEELLKDIQRQALATMKELQDSVQQIVEAKGLSNLKVMSRVVGGEVEHELRELCSEWHPDLVVMGTTGRGNTLQVWGKVSTFIMDHAHVPVITVPAIRQFRGFESLMFAADLGDSNEFAIRKINETFSPFQHSLHVVHFAPKLKAGDAFMKMKALELKFSHEKSFKNMTFQVIEYEEDNQKAIDMFVAQNQIDLIGFQPHKRSLLAMLFTRKITRKNLFETNIPMIAVPAQ
jgi:nucleotide-binding universal stress UspA family protein